MQMNYFPMKKEKVITIDEIVDCYTNNVKTKKAKMFHPVESKETKETLVTTIRNEDKCVSF